MLFRSQFRLFTAMHYVYLLPSALENRRHYTSFTHNLRAQLTRRVPFRTGRLPRLTLAA